MLTPCFTDEKDEAQRDYVADPSSSRREVQGWHPKPILLITELVCPLEL